MNDDQIAADDVLAAHVDFFRTMHLRNMAVLEGRRPLMLAPRGCYPIGSDFPMPIQDGKQPARILQWWSEKDGTYAAVCWVAGLGPNNPFPTGHLRVAVAAPGDSVLPLN